MDPQIEEIKQKLPVEQVVGSYVKLTRTGINLRGICPFHQERKPSFFVSPHRQMWHCFGCGVGGSIFDFVMRIEGVEFGDALRQLAQKAGVELKRENPQLRTERQRLYEIVELACSFFQKQLEESMAGKEAKAYLLERGITQESIQKWRLGYSPDTWSGLTDFLISKGYQREEVVKAGLGIAKERNLHDSYDRFRGRIMFAILDLNGQPVGFGGRVFKQGSDKETAKYINTPQTLLYDKSGILYGLNFAKLAVRKEDRCVVVEGYTDAIMCHQAGFENTVASSGTALTQRHLTLLKRYSDHLVLAFDMDMAGDSATKRGIHLAEEQGFDISVVESYGEEPVGLGQMRQKSDPAEIILKDPSVWANAVAHARGIMDYYFSSALAAFDRTTAEGKKRIGQVVLPAIRRLPSRIEQSHWLQKLSDLISIPENVLEKEMNQATTSPSAALRAPLNSAHGGIATEQERKKRIEEKILALALKFPLHLAKVAEEDWKLFSERTARLLKGIASSAVPAAEEDRQQLAMLAMKADAEYGQDDPEEISLCIFQLKTLELKNTRQQLSEQIRQAELAGDAERVRALTAEYRQVNSQLHASDLP